MQHAVVVVVEAAELTPRLAAHAEVVEAADADERARRVGKVLLGQRQPLLQ